MSMNSRLLTFIFLVCFLGCLPAARSQETPRKVHKNEVKAGVGIASSRQFTGWSAMAGYHRFFGKNFVGVQFNFLEEMSLFGQKDGSTSDLSLTLNRRLLNRGIEISLGAGIAHVRHKLYSTPNDIIVNQTGVPIELNITTGNEWLRVGGNFHYNINDYNPFMNFNLMIAFRFL